MSRLLLLLIACLGLLGLVHAQDVRPRMANRLITDKGHLDRARGWYDAQCQGVANDYCRYVGYWPNIWWSCALAGSSNQYSPNGAYTEKTTSPVPCSKDPAIPKENQRPPRNFALSDMGYTDRRKGWFDALCRGAADDYCRYVGPTLSYPYTWFSCALAGADTEHTAPGRFTESNIGCAPGQIAPLAPLPPLGPSAWSKASYVKTPRNFLLRDMGYPDRTSGWFDAQCRGSADDYCRYVGPSRYHSEVWWSCALAGADSEHTDPGRFTESTTSRVPCSNGAATNRKLLA